MKRIAVLVVAFAATFGVAASAGAGPAHAAGPAARTATYSMRVAGLQRSYRVITPAATLPRSAPVIVMLSGINASVSLEISRDDLVPYAAAGMAELVYPVAYQESWNALGGCCGAAATHKVNDIAFLKALVARVDPGHRRPAYVIGYSNGARLAYRIACTDPALFDAYALVKGGPTRDCALKPVTVEQLAAVDDPEVPYQPGMKGREPTAATTLVARWRATDKCQAKPVTTGRANPALMVRPAGKANPALMALGRFTVESWNNCAAGKRLAFAVWPGGGHSFPRPPTSNPAAAQVIWSFFTRTPLAPLP